jgi:hypothetical protein
MQVPKASVVFVAVVMAMVPAVPGHAYEEVAVSDGGTIQGKVLYQGRVPTRKIIPTKDQDVCGGIRDQAEVVVGPDKGVQHAVVYLKKVAKGKAWPEAEPLKMPVLDQEKCRFMPHVQVIQAGPLEIVNSDPILHNTHGFYGRRSAFNLALPNQDQRITTELERPGMVKVECDAHGWMLAWVYVADSPYYAVTAEDGAFTITDIPPGDYTLVAWQEFTGPVETGVTVEAGKASEIDIEIKK